jgi:hypothetical protein
MRVGMPVHLFAPLSFSSQDLSPIYCNLIHQKVIDNQLFVGFYQYISDIGRYDKVEQLENPAAPARDCKIFHKKCISIIQAIT